MKTAATSVALLSLFTAIQAHPSHSRLHVRGCQPGVLVCQGTSHFGLCNIDSSVIFMAVSDGTQCVCSGSDCTIAALEGGSAPAPQPSTGSASTPASTSEAAPPSSPAASQPSQPSPSANQPSQAPASSPDAPASPAASSTSSGGIFKEIPTATLPPSSAQSSSASSASPSSAEPSATASPSSGSSGPAPSVSAGSTDYIKTFLGTGASSEGWPSQSQWGSFDSLWNANLNLLQTSCKTSWGLPTNNSPTEIANLKTAIQNVAKSSGVDASFILAIVMQESIGCVSVKTTNNGVINPGLMQSHNGAHSCSGLSECPMSEIQGMIEDGVEGTPSGDGLKQCLTEAGGSGAEQYYRAARIYNSGSIASSGLLQGGGATHCYSSDVANRLLGWNAGTSGCHVY